METMKRWKNEIKFKMTKRGDYSCLRNVFYFHGNLLISFGQVNFGTRSFRESVKVC
jgi:hypothetical protein